MKLPCSISKWTPRPATSKRASSLATKTCAAAWLGRPWSTREKASGQPCATKSTSAAYTVAPSPNFKKLQNEPETSLLLQQLPLRNHADSPYHDADSPLPAMQINPPPQCRFTVGQGIPA